MILGRAKQHVLKKDQCKNCLGFGHWAFQCPSPKGQDLPKIQEKKFQNSVSEGMILPQAETFFCEEILHVDERMYQASKRDICEKVKLDRPELMPSKDSTQNLRRQMVLCMADPSTDLFVQRIFKEDVTLQEESFFCEEIFFTDKGMIQESMRDLNEKLILEDKAEDSVRDLREKLISYGESLVKDPVWEKPDAVVEDLAIDLEQPLILGEESMQHIQEKLILGKEARFLAFFSLLASALEDLKSWAKSLQRHIGNSADGSNLALPVSEELLGLKIQAMQVLESGFTIPELHEIIEKTRKLASACMLKVMEDCRWTLILRWATEEHLKHLQQKWLMSQLSQSLMTLAEILAYLCWQNQDLRPFSRFFILNLDDQCPRWLVSCMKHGLTESEEEISLDDIYGVDHEFRNSYCWEYSSFESFLAFTIIEITVDTFVWDPG